jgi:hypothetical protein
MTWSCTGTVPDGDDAGVIVFVDHEHDRRAGHQPALAISETTAPAVTSSPGTIPGQRHCALSGRA